MPADFFDSRNFVDFFEKTISSAPCELSPLSNLLTETFIKNGWREITYSGVILSFEEAVVNAARHGNQFDPKKMVRIRCGISPDLVRLEIIDEGAGFNPKKVPDPTLQENLSRFGGRGIHLMVTFMDHVWYNSNGNSVAMEKRLTDDNK